MSLSCRESTTDDEQAKHLLDVWLHTSFDGGRHARRVDEMDHPPIMNTTFHAREENFRPRRSRSGDFQRGPARETTAAGKHRVDRQRELRLAGHPRGRRHGVDEQIRGRLSRPALLRRLRIRGHRRATRHRPRQAAFRRPSTPTSSRIPVRRPTWPCISPRSKHGDTILTMELAHGGHLTHGSPRNFSGRFYKVVHYGVRQDNEMIDYDQLAETGAGVSSENDHGRCQRLSARSSISNGCARLPIASARCCLSTWRTSPAWSPRAFIPPGAATPILSRPRPTKRCADRAPA